MRLRHEPFDDDFEPREDVVCDKCGEGDLRWHHTGVRWALLDGDNRIHCCTVAKADDFDDVSGAAK